MKEVSPSGITVEVAFVTPADPIVLEIVLPKGATVDDALRCAGQDERLSSAVRSADTVGIFGQICERDRVLTGGERVEIYRDLIVDAKTARRQRAMQHSQVDA